MSVVLAASMFDGVVLVADTRATVQVAGRPDVHIDDVQKLVPLTPHAVLGFVGDIGTAGALFDGIRKLRPRDSRTAWRRSRTPSLIGWLPRYFRHAYAKLPTARHVVFVLGAVVPDRPNVIERAKAIALLDRFRTGDLSGERNWMPDILPRMLMAPPQVTHIGLGGVPQGVIAVMSAPKFEPRFVHPLEHVAVGSGDGVHAEIEYRGDMIFAGDVGNSFAEGDVVRRAAESWLRANDVPSVGGMLVGYKVSSQGMEELCYADETPVGGPRISLHLDEKQRWVQQNHATGKRIVLRPPWEARYTARDRPARFDDLDNAYRDLKGLPRR